MPRPMKGRNVCCLPRTPQFGPMGRRGRAPGGVTMTVDEFETIRLIDYVGFTQEECAKQMDVARTTVQGIYALARKKLAQALIDSLTLTIEGGEYRLYGGNWDNEACRSGFCHRHGGRVNEALITVENQEEKNMIIAVPIDQNKQDSGISASFGRALAYLLHDSENNTTKILENTAGMSAGGAGIQAAQLIADSGATALITPRCGANAANVLLAAGVKLYRADPALSVAENVKAYINGDLKELDEIHEGFHKH